MQPCSSRPPPPSSTYHLVTCPLPGTSEAGSAGSGCGWYGRSGSSSDEGRSRLHCSADSSWRSPAQETYHRNTSSYWINHCGWNHVLGLKDQFMSFSANKIHYWLTVICCIPSGDIFILLLPNRLGNNTTVMVLSWLLHSNIWHSNSTVFHQYVQHEGGVFGQEW